MHGTDLENHTYNWGQYFRVMGMEGKRVGGRGGGGGGGRVMTCIERWRQME